MRLALPVVVGLIAGSTAASNEQQDIMEANVETGLPTRSVTVYQFMLPEKNSWSISDGKKKICEGGPYTNWYAKEPTECKLPTGSYSVTCCDTRSKEGWTGGHVLIEGDNQKLCEQFNWNTGKECYTQKFGVVIPTPKPTPVPTPKPKPLLGASLVNAGLQGFWFTAPKVGMTCTELCSSKGLVFDKANSKHSGNQAGKKFWPQKAPGGNWVTIECSSTDNNRNWGANGGTPDANFKHPACHVNCACKNR